MMLRTALRLTLLVLPCAIADHATGQTRASDLLQITSPASGSIVNPGQKLLITVTSPAKTGFDQVMVIGELGIMGIGNSLPAQFSFSIPANISCRSYTLTAIGITPSGQEVESPEALIHVERTDAPTSLYTEMPAIEFDNLGEDFPVKISANFSDGTSCDITESSKLVWGSSSTTVARVDAVGMVTALGVGKASISATYGGKFHITIPITVPPQALEPSVSSLNFGGQTVGIASNPQRIFLTNKTYSPMKIFELSTTGDFSEKDNCRSLSPLAAGSPCMINVTFTPTEAGLRTGSVSISQGFNGAMKLSLSG